MLCKNCGKEIPDDAKFCGFCGAEVKAEETPVTDNKDTEETPVTEEAAPVEDKAAEAEDKAAEAETAAPKEETNEDAASEEHTIGDDITDSMKQTAAGKAILGDDGKLNKEDFTRMGNTAKEGFKTAYESVAWDEFKVFIDIFKDPFGDHAMPLLPSIVTAVIAVLINWWAFGTFATAIVVGLIFYAAVFLVLFIGKNEEKFDWKKAFGKVSQIVTIPVISLFVMCLFSISMRGSLNNTSTSTYNMMSYVYALRSSVVIVCVFLMFAIVTYVMGVIKAVKKINGYLLAVILTASFSIALFYFISSLISTLMSSLM